MFGHYGWPERGEVFFTHTGEVERRGNDSTVLGTGTRLILKPLEIHHPFGGVIWKEGETRTPKKGEVYLIRRAPVNLGFATFNYSEETYPILTPIALA